MKIGGLSMRISRIKMIGWILAAIFLSAFTVGCRTQSTVSVSYEKNTGNIAADAVNAPKNGGGTLDLTLEEDGKIIVNTKMKRGSFHVRVSADGAAPLIDADFSGIAAMEYPAEAGTYTVSIAAEKTSTGTLTVETVNLKETSE